MEFKEVIRNRYSCKKCCDRQMEAERSAEVHGTNALSTMNN